MRLMTSNTPAERAAFVARDRCIACDSTLLDQIAAGRFDEEPLRGMIERDPWGECPTPYLQDSPWELVACRECGQMFHRWVLDDAWQVRRFSQWMGLEAMQRFAADHGLNAFRWRFHVGAERMAHVLRLEQLTRQSRKGERPRLLDFGCGYGDFVATAKLMGFDACGVDWDASRIRGRFSADLHIYHDLAELDVDRNQPFHAIALFETLEHLVSPREVLQQLGKRMVPGGILVLETPDCTGVRGIQSEEDYGAIHPLEHLNAFTPTSLERFARQVGFVPMAKPVAWATCDLKQAVKIIAKRALRRWLRPTTQAYFVLV